MWLKRFDWRLDSNGGNIEKEVLSSGLSLQHFLKEEQVIKGFYYPHQPTHTEVIIYIPPDYQSQVTIHTEEQRRKMARAHSRQQLGNDQIVKRKSSDEEEIDECPEAEHVPRLGLGRV